MNRFHITVFNHNRIDSFINNFVKIQNFNPDKDAVLIFDCSPGPLVQSELMGANQLCAYGLAWGRNLFFIKRRNWGDNLGGQLDYFRCLRNGLIEYPKYSAFMQEHYLDLDYGVKEDTIPENASFDLNRISDLFEEDNKIGCAFFARYGVRVITSNPVIDPAKEFFGDGEILFPRAERRGLLVDGGNFITKPELYLNWFNQHPNYLTSGDGSHQFSLIWEGRLGQILYDQKIKWYDLGRNISYQTIADLDKIECEQKNKVSKLWYDHRIWTIYYALDQWKYWPLPFRSFIHYLPIFIKNYLKCTRDTSIVFLQPEETNK